MEPKQALPRQLWAIMAIGLVLRLLGAWYAHLTFDERAILALGQTIDFSPDGFHLVSRSVAHPLLAIYVMKFSGMLFGTSDFGLRLLHVLAGTATIIPVFLLARQTFSERAGLWAAALLAVDQFHASWSRVVLHEGLLLLFVALALVQFLRVLETPRWSQCALLGALVGFGYLGKEPAVLLWPIFWIFLLLSRQLRFLLKRPEWYLAHVVFALVVAPDVIWNMALGAVGYFYRDLAFVTAQSELSLKSLSLYLGEVFRVVVGADVLDEEYDQGVLFACHWPAGMLYLVSVVAVWKRRQEPAVTLLLVIFFFVFLLFVVVPGGTRFEPFWWASISLISTVVFAGYVLDRISSRGKVAMTACLIFTTYLGLYYASVSRARGFDARRATVEQFVDDFFTRADKALSDGRLEEAESRYIFILNMDGPNAAAYYGMGCVAQRRGQLAKAKWLYEKCRDLAPDHLLVDKRLQELRAKESSE